MSSAVEVAATIERSRVVAIVRLAAPDLWVGESLIDGGMRVAELSLAAEGSMSALESWSRHFGDEVLLGAGTVLTASQAEQAVAAGARFLVGPNFDGEVLATAKRLGILYIPGVLTPTELARAQAVDCALIKLFPAGRLGPQYIRDLLGPFPSARLVATGGVDVRDVLAHIAAGAAAVAFGGALVDERATREQIRERAASLTAALARAAA